MWLAALEPAAISTASWLGLSRPPRFCLLCVLIIMLAGTSAAMTGRVIRDDRNTLQKAPRRRAAQPLRNSTNPASRPALLYSDCLICVQVINLALSGSSAQSLQKTEVKRALLHDSQEKPGVEAQHDNSAQRQSPDGVGDVGGNYGRYQCGHSSREKRPSCGKEKVVHRNHGAMQAPHHMRHKPQGHGGRVGKCDAVGTERQPHQVGAADQWSYHKPELQAASLQAD